MTLLCCVVNCTSSSKRDKVRFFRVPGVLNFKHRIKLNELSFIRRKKWIAALKKTENKLKYAYVCSRHFASGKPAKLEEDLDLDWVPTLNMNLGPKPRYRTPKTVEWSESLTFQLIDLYREHECLWNPMDTDYRNKLKKSEAWNEISNVMNCDTNELMRKIGTLLGTFRRECRKLKNSIKVGSGPDEIYQPIWFAFHNMIFLIDKFMATGTRHTKGSLGIDDQEHNTTDDNTLILPIEDIQETELALLTTPPSISIIPTKIKQISANNGINRTNEAKQTDDSVANQNMRDESTVYGEHVASKLRNYTAHTKCIVEHLIENILLRADMGHYEPQITSSNLQNQLSNTNQYPVISHVRSITSPSITDSLIVREEPSETSQNNFIPISSPYHDKEDHTYNTIVSTSEKIINNVFE